MAITKWRFGALQTWDLNGCEQVAKPDRHADGGARDPQYLTKGGVAHRVEVESVRSTAPEAQVCKRKPTSSKIRLNLA
jgi:hypothetical protein